MFGISSYRPLTMQVYQQINRAIWIILYLNILGKGNGDNSMIDQDHLKKYPFCGSMFGANTPVATSRISNAKPATKDYRWVVEVIKTTIQADKTFEDELCSGSIITER